MEDASWVTGTINSMSYRGKIYCVVPEKRNREYSVCRVSDKEGEFKSSYYIVEKKKEKEAEPDRHMDEAVAGEEAGEEGGEEAEPDRHMDEAVAGEEEGEEEGEEATELEEEAADE
ncbi:hypothetical protein OAO87_02880 [bacterium]|nr:hypothetical protein [bacterium]